MDHEAIHSSSLPNDLSWPLSPRLFLCRTIFSLLIMLLGFRDLQKGEGPPASHPVFALGMLCNSCIL